MNDKIKKASSHINKAIDILWEEAYTYGPSMESWAGHEWIASSDITQRVKNIDIDRCIRLLQDAKTKIENLL